MTISTYSDYIERFIHAEPPPRQRHPGEHHFVSTYLLPRLDRITRRTPYYVNPDGMKRVPGDVIYYSHDHLSLSVEVKYDVIRLTTNEFNRGICDHIRKHWP